MQAIALVGLGRFAMAGRKFVRFRSKGQPRGLLQARDQRRVTLVILGVGALAILISVAGKPGFWAMVTGKPVSSTTDKTATGANLGSRTLLHDEFISGNGLDDEDPSSIDPRTLLDLNEAARLESLNKQTATESADLAVPPIPAELLRPVRDDVIGVHTSEADAYFASLRLAERLKPSEAAKAPEGRFSLFMGSPESCRGNAWLLKGKLRRLERLQNDANSFGLKTLYDAWISLPDSGDQLVHVVAVSADRTLPLAQSMGKEPPVVEFTGYFFKREGYVRSGSDGQGDAGLTPMLLTGHLRRFEIVQVAGNDADELTPWMGWLTLIISIAVVLVIWQFKISDSLFRRTRTHQLTTLPVRVSFDGVNAVTINDMLRDMQADGYDGSQHEVS